MRVAPLLLAAVVVVAACGDRGPLPRKVANDSVSALLQSYQAQVEQAQQANALKDSAMAQLTTATQLMDQLGDIEREMGVRQQTPSPETGVTWDSIARRRLETIRARFAVLNRQARQLRTLTAEDVKLHAQLDSLLSLSSSQTTRISGLMAQLDSLQAENQRLTSSNTARADTIRTITDESNKVYYVIGDKKQLIDQGVIRQVGGARWLLFTRVGETLVPAQALKPADFQVADMRTLKEIPLPDDNKYEVVSRQDLQYVDPANVVKGRVVQGKLQITGDGFWAPSKFLILVRK
jgi:predicted small lipoprotein YifL